MQGTDTRFMIQIPNYEIGKLAGRGGIAEVYLARHKLLDRTVAIKLICPAQADVSIDTLILCMIYWNQAPNTVVNVVLRHSDTGHRMEVPVFLDNRSGARPIEVLAPIERMGKDIAELHRQINILSTEKGRTSERARDIATAVREYIKNQMRDQRNFLTNIALEDFIGDALIERANTGEENIMVVHVAHPVPSGGQVNGIGGYFNGSGNLVVKLLRPTGNDFIVIYDKQISVSVETPGEQPIDFDSPFIVKKGDIIAYYFPGPVIVPHDINIGTTAYLKMRSDQYPHGSRVASADIWREGQPLRKYSLNYYGIFYTRVDQE